MPHFPKPFYKKNRQTWYVEIDRKQINLGRDREAAFRKYHELMTAREKEAPPASDTVVVVMDQFLEWCLRQREKRTYDSYVQRTQSFVSTISPEMTVDQLKPFHVQKWVDDHENWSDGMKRGHIAAVQRALNWAVKMGLIDRSPIAHMEKPKQGRREQIITPSEFEKMLTRVPNQNFRDLLEFSWFTGARPQETIIIEAHHVDVSNKRVILTPEESKGKRTHRVIYLSDEATALVERLVGDKPHGPIFRNIKGSPWTPYAVNCAFNRLQLAIGREKLKELGIKPDEKEIATFAEALPKTKIDHGKEVLKTQAELRSEARKKLTNRLARGLAEKVCLYVFRHSWAQRALQSGIDPVTVSVLLGHSDTTMLTKVYQHLARDSGYLQEAARKVNQQVK